MHDDDGLPSRREQFGLDGDIEKCCESCRFWCPPYDGERGECRKYAPSPMNVRDSARSHSVETYWPAMSKDDWCGEFEKHEEGWREP